jgi:hypothetical protein
MKGYTIYKEIKLALESNNDKLADTLADKEYEEKN